MSDENADGETSEIFDADDADDPAGVEVMNTLFGGEAESADADGEDAASTEGETDPPPAEGEPAVEEPAVAEPEPEPTVQGEQPAAESAEEPEKAQPAPEPAPAPAEPVAEPAPATLAPEQQPETQLSAEQLQEQFHTNRKIAVDHLTEHYRKHLEGDELVGLDPESVTPIANLMGQVYIDAVSTAMVQIARVLPAAVQNATTQTDGHRQAEEAFYTQWPQLREHGEAVTQLAAAYRHQNPMADAATFNQHVGAMALVSLGISPEPVAAPAHAPEPEPPAPAFQPAGRTGAPRTNSSAPVNEFDKMTQEFSENLD